MYHGTNNWHVIADSIIQSPASLYPLYKYKTKILTTLLDTMYGSLILRTD